MAEGAKRLLPRPLVFLFRWWGVWSEECFKSLDWTPYVCLVVYALNLSDLFLTIPVYELEINPVLFSIPAMVVIKVVLVALFLLVILVNRRLKVARVGLLVLLFVYVGVNIWHLTNIL